MSKTDEEAHFAMVLARFMAAWWWCHVVVIARFMTAVVEARLQPSHAYSLL
jgi:hypothetical protein